MGGMVTVWALHLPEGAARDAQGFVGVGGPCTSQKATMPEFPVTSVLKDGRFTRLLVHSKRLPCAEELVEMSRKIVMP
jgi:hypothetical protein